VRQGACDRAPPGARRTWKCRVPDENSLSSRRLKNGVVACRQTTANLTFIPTGGARQRRRYEISLKKARNFACFRMMSINFAVPSGKEGAAGRQTRPSLSGISNGGALRSTVLREKTRPHHNPHHIASPRNCATSHYITIIFIFSAGRDLGDFGWGSQGKPKQKGRLCKTSCRRGGVGVLICERIL